MRLRIGLYFLIVISGLIVSCASLPSRVYADKEMKLDPQKTERVWFFGMSDYVSDVMEHVKGYVEPVSKASEWISWVYIIISGAMFVAGFPFFAIAYLTHAYKFNYVGIISIVGAGFAAGFAEFAYWSLTVPITLAVALLTWFITHRNKNFSLWHWIKSREIFK